MSVSNNSDTAINSKDKLLLAIDCGTQSVRALVFDRNGNLLAKSQVALDNYFSDNPGWIEQHGHFFWDSLCRVCQKLWQQKVISPSSICGVSVTTQRATVLYVDQKGEPLRPAITWMDQRRATIVPTLPLYWRLVFKVAGVSDTVNEFMQDAEINWMRQHQPDVLSRAHKCLLLSGYFHFHLSGEFKDSIGAQVGYLPFDYKKQRWANINSWKSKACPIPKDLLPELVTVGETLGKVTKSAAQQTGLPEGLPIVASAADKACETLGCGLLNESVGQVSYGTTATFNVVTKKYREPMRYLPPYPSAIPAHYTCEYQIHRGFWMVSWFKDQFAHQESSEAALRELSTETLLDQQAANIDPGANGLMLQPYWSPGVRYPGPEARGAIIGFTDAHTKAHIYRALLEGIAFGLRHGKEKMERRNRLAIQQIFVSGGGSQSSTALQITADIFNLPVIRPKTFETSGLGAAINIAVNQQLFPNYASAIESMCHFEQPIMPKQENVKLYDSMYHGVYRKLYRRLAPLYKIMHKLF
ncbi:MAG: carbohydrate kinase [Gammaproteobacteria bacterium]|nr:carbohydrate kinase [Gammaproteobacteria bacterium]